MSMVKLIKQDKKLVALLEMCRKKYGYNPIPFNFDQYASIKDYKKAVKEFVKKNLGKSTLQKNRRHRKGV